MPCFFRAEISADGTFAAPGLEQDVLVGELLLDAVDVGVGLVDLVDRDDDRDLGGAGVVDRLDRLRHDAVVGRDDQDDDVGRLGAAGAHRREGLVARRVEEDDRLAVDLDAVGADVLRDAAGLARGDVGLADRVEQRGLAVVDVAHDRDDRGARNARSAGRRALAAVLGRARRARAPPRRRRPRPRRRSPWRSGPPWSASSVWLTVAITPRCISSRWMSRASTPSFSESSLTVTPSEKKTGPGRQRLLELEELARVVRPGLLGRAADGGLGDRARAGGGSSPSSPVFSISGSEMSE